MPAILSRPQCVENSIKHSVFYTIYSKVFVVVCFVFGCISLHTSPLSYYFFPGSMVLTQPYDWPSASEATLKDMGKMDHDLPLANTIGCICYWLVLVDFTHILQGYFTGVYLVMFYVSSLPPTQCVTQIQHRNGWEIPSQTLLGVWLLIHVSKRGPNKAWGVRIIPGNYAHSPCFVGIMRTPHALLGPLLLTWIRNHTPSKVWDGISHPIHPTLYNGCNYLPMLVSS